MKYGQGYKSLIIGVLLLFGSINAGWFPLKGGNMDAVPDIQLISSTNTTLVFNVSIPGFRTEVVNTNNMINAPQEMFTLLSLPEYSYTGEISNPKLPAIRQTIDIPYNAIMQLEVVSSKYVDISLPEHGIDGKIMPVLAPVVKMPGEKPVFTINNRVYGQNAYYPGEIVAVENVDIMRKHRLAVLGISPIQYNPASKTIRCYTDIQVRVTFNGGDIVKTMNTIQGSYSPIFENFLKQRVLNYRSFARDSVQGLPIRYLIVTHNSFMTQVNNLAFWLKKKGFTVKIANQDSIASWTVTGIENYITAQNPQPTYLLLVGDVNGGYIPAPTGGSSGECTDLYYAETDGSGFLPDIFHGRLSVENTTHITTIIDKILKYEKANLPAGWFKKDAFCAGTDNYTVSEGTHNYCTSTFMDPNGYATSKLYMVTYGATTTDVTNNVNDGRSLITMSGHGNEDGWYDGPQFLVGNVNALTNGDKLTIATGHCCLANNFGSSGVNPCGGESWIRKSGGGGVAYYGSCPSTYWDEDDWLQREWYEGIYSNQIYEHGIFTEDGMYDGVYMSGSTMKQYYYEAYHVLGDPSLDFWTNAPGTMTVVHNAIVFPGTSSFSVTVTAGGSPVDDALVCCWVRPQSPAMHVAAYTNASGVASLTVSPTTPGDTMYVTVTKHDRIPYEGYAIVTSPSGPYVTMGMNIINDSGGDGQANPGETIDLGIWAKNVGVAQAQGVYGLMSEADPYASLSIDSAWYGNIAAGDSAISNPYYEFGVANNCPNGHAVTFDLYFHDVFDSTWMAHPIVTVYAPVLTYQSVSVVGGNGNGILDAGETANLVVTIKNDGGANAANVTSTLMESSTWVTINDASGNFGTINVGATADNAADPYTVTASGSTPTGTVVDFQIRVVSGVYVDTLEFSLVVGKKHYYLWNPDPTPTPGSNCHTILGNLGYSGDYGTSLAADLTLYQAVLVCVGIYSNNYVVGSGSAEAAALVDFLQNQGGRMYLEGGDVWYYDPLNQGGYNFGSLFGINATADGSGDVGPVQGQTGTFTNGMNFTYGGENSWIDHIDPTGAGFLIFRDTDNAYNCGVANDQTSYRTVGMSFELGLLNDGSGVSTRAALLDSIMHFFGIVVVVAEEEAGLTALGAKFGLHIHPSIASRNVRIAYGLGHSAKSGELKIYDTSGRIVRSFALGPSSTALSILWNGTDDAGRLVPAGVYFVKLEAGDQTQVQKAVLLR